jgi:predicted aspartyl protease
MGFRTGLLAALILASGCASPLVLDDDNAAFVTPLKTGSDGHILVPAMVNGQGPFRFALDTGASISVLFDTTVDQKDLDLSEGKQVVIQGMVGSGVFPVATIAELTVGGESWINARVALLPGDDRTSDEFDGILGVDFLRRYALGVSVEDQVVRLYPPLLVSERSYRGWSSIPMHQIQVGKGGATVYTIELHISEVPIPAMLDLGAGSNLMNWHTARKIRVRPNSPGRGTEISGALETVPVTAELEVDELRIGNIYWRDRTFLVSDFPIFEALDLDDRLVAIIGPSLFSERDFVIDFERMRMLIGAKK